MRTRAPKRRQSGELSTRRTPRCGGFEAGKLGGKAKAAKAAAAKAAAAVVAELQAERLQAERLEGAGL